jgi:hypothetical protein
MPFAFALALIGPAVGQSSPQSATPQHGLPGARITAAQRQAFAAFGPDISIAFGDNEVPASIRGALSGRSYPADPAAEAQAALRRYAAALRAGPDDEFSFISAEQRGSGLSVRMAQAYRGIPVINAGLIVEMTGESVTAIRGRFEPDLDILPTPALSAYDASDRALSYARDHGYRSPQVVETQSMVIFIDDNGVGHLTIPVQVSQDGPQTTADAVMFIDAVSGGVLASRAAPAKPQLCCFSSAPNALQNPNFNPQGFTSSCGVWGSCTMKPAEVPWGGYGYGPICSSYPCFPSEYKQITDILPGLGGGAQLNGFSWKSGLTWLYQTVTVPSNAVTATLQFYLRIDAWTVPRQVTDTLKVGIIGGVNMTIPAPGSCCDWSIGEQKYTNLDNDGDPFGYYLSQPLTVNVSSYRGQCITVSFLAEQAPNSVNAFYVKNASLTFSSGPTLLP